MGCLLTKDETIATDVDMSKRNESAAAIKSNYEKKLYLVSKLQFIGPPIKTNRLAM